MAQFSQQYYAYILLINETLCSQEKRMKTHLSLINLKISEPCILQMAVWETTTVQTGLVPMFRDIPKRFS